MNGTSFTARLAARVTDAEWNATRGCHESAAGTGSASRHRALWAAALGLCAVATACATDADPARAGTAADGKAGQGGSLSPLPSAEGSIVTSTGGRTNHEGVNLVVSTGHDSPDAGIDIGDAHATCGSVQVDAQVKTEEKVVVVPGNVLFVFDQSDSMNDLWNGKPKWRAANDAVVGAFGPLKDQLSAGAILFPTESADADNAAAACNWLEDPLGCLAASTSGDPLCPDVASLGTPPQLSIQPGSAFLGSWNQYWTQGALALNLGTPTEKALLQGEAALTKPPPGNTAMVLVTDGLPTCGSNESAVAARLLKKNIKTYVVGLPGATGSNVLDPIAIAGNTAPSGCTSNCYLTPADPDELQEALAAIASKTVTTSTTLAIDDCTFTLTPPKDADPASVHLVVTATADGLQYEMPRTGGNGWSLAEDHMTATLEGSVCEQAKEGAFSSFSFQYGCVTVPPFVPVPK